MSRGAVSICASPLCQRNSGRASCSAFLIVRRLTSTSKGSASPITSTNPSSTSSTDRGARGNYAPHGHGSQAVHHFSHAQARPGPAPAQGHLPTMPHDLPARGNAAEPTRNVAARHGDRSFYYGKGCDACNQTGYKG